jgi:D-cysteine desulfhydrase
MFALPDLPPRLSLAHLPTPLRRLERISAELDGPDIWLKCDDMTGSVLSGNKVRKLEFLLADALAQGADTIITCGGIQSNHCRATALACAQLGLKCILLLREGDYPRPAGIEQSKEEGNLFLDAMANAETHIYPKAEYVRLQSRLFKEAEARVRAVGATPYSIPTGGSNGIGVWGYLTGGMEILADCKQAGFVPDAIVCASGSGGTQAGLTLAQAFAPPDAGSRTIGMAVCDSADWFNRKTVQDITQWCQHAGLAESEQHQLFNALDIQTIDDYIGPGYARPYPEMLTLLRRLAALEGVVLDPVYTGKAFYGLLNEIRKGNFRDMRNIVFVHTGGTFGLYPYARALLDIPW